MTDRFASQRRAPRRTIGTVSAGLAFLANLAFFATAVAQTMPTMEDCEQTDSAPLVIRACTFMLNRFDVEPAERKRILLLRAVAWSKEGDFQPAAKDFTSALAIEPNNVQALEGRAKVLGKAGEYVKAAVDWTSLLAMQPKSDEYFRARGLAYLGGQEFDKALADFDKSIAINQQEVEAFMGRAQVFDAMDDHERAKAEFERGIAVKDNYLPLYWMRGEMARAWGDKDLAIKSYRQVLALNGVYEDARRRLQHLGIMHPP